jgi:hypothetical protein
MLHRAPELSIKSPPSLLSYSDVTRTVPKMRAIESGGSFEHASFQWETQSSWFLCLMGSAYRLLRSVYSCSGVCRVGYAISQMSSAQYCSSPSLHQVCHGRRIVFTILQQTASMLSVHTLKTFVLFSCSQYSFALSPSHS